MQVLKSELDASVNFVNTLLSGQSIEARYVRREQHYVAGYLSSQTGCNHGCKFCHLTTTKQTKFRDCTIEEFRTQADQILSYYDYTPDARFINWNFMARGEPLANKILMQDPEGLFDALDLKSSEHCLIPKYNISTIIPKDTKSLVDTFEYSPIVNIYYSIYSADPDFRKEWMPMAMDLNDALDLLKEYQMFSNKIITFHSAFIKNENDSSIFAVQDMMDAIKKKEIIGQFNIVQYNPYSELQGEETENYESIKGMIGRYMPVKIVSRVGSDIHASCGQFATP